MYSVIKRELTDAWLGFFVWTGPNRPLAQAARQKGTENFAIIAAAALPWSTSVASSCALAFLIGFLTTVKPSAFFCSLKQPASMATLVLCLLALLGVLWAVEISWPERLRGLTPMGKLLGIPILIYCFSQSDRGQYVFYAFVASCTVLMLYSWVVLFWPGLSIHYKSDQPGVPVKNYIDQSQGFVFCSSALAAVTVESLRRRQRAIAVSAVLIAAALLANLAFVNVSRTALVYSPVLAALFAYRYLGRRKFWIACPFLLAVIAGLWVISPNLQRKVSAAFTEYRVPRTEQGTTSVGQRLELWNKSMEFFKTAPIIGHGTGSAKPLFVRDAGRQNSLSTGIIGNPHNQTLLFVIQWGFVGGLALYFMWTVHLLTFRGEGVVAWIGLVAVVQNILSSLFNSHLSDFYQGWLYVLAVGIAAGTIRKTANSQKKVCRA
ncbi:O-antigen ligase family protein [Afipia massiliensis]|uniref:O-antigen ligase family protein n=1 Tax=Afipia massiliensis TaxID=211460 RepID=A0A4U6BVJ8_9BRAD|nr:O-antigen ligase family protein [Afipia massiliensis]TKT72914.1 O-antigen ligase family protein [Afipia massiliensis]